MSKMNVRDDCPDELWPKMQKLALGEYLDKMKAKISPCQENEQDECAVHDDCPGELWTKMQKLALNECADDCPGRLRANINQSYKKEEDEGFRFFAWITSRNTYLVTSLGEMMLPKKLLSLL